MKTITYTFMATATVKVKTDGTKTDALKAAKEVAKAVGVSIGTYGAIFTSAKIKNVKIVPEGK